MRAGTLIVGIGSPHGDDAVGWQIARALRQQLPGATIGEASTPDRLLDWLPGVQRLHVVDACRSGVTAPGTLHHWEWPQIDAAALGAPWSSHGLSMLDALHLAARLQTLPARVTIWGVEMAQAAPASEPSAVLGEQIEQLAARIAAAITAD